MLFIKYNMQKSKEDAFILDEILQDIKREEEQILSLVLHEIKD